MSHEAKARKLVAFWGWIEWNELQLGHDGSISVHITPNKHRLHLRPGSSKLSSISVISRVGQNCIYAPYMTV
jgi:hypothetical protein